MPSLKRTNILKPERDMLAFPDHYVNLPGFVSYQNLLGLAYADETGKQVVGRGAIVHIKADGEVVKADTTYKANGIVFNTIPVSMFDESDTQINVTVLVHGFVRADRLVGDVDALKANAPNILVVAQ